MDGFRSSLMQMGFLLEPFPDGPQRPGGGEQERGLRLPSRADAVEPVPACRRMLASFPGEGRPDVCVGRLWSCVSVVRSSAAGVPRERTRR